MRNATVAIESFHHVPAIGWTEAGLSVLRAGKLVAAPSYRIERASHPGQDIIVCLEGSGTVLTLGQSFEVRPGQLAWMANEAPHRHAANPNDPWTVLWFRLAGPSPHRLRRTLFGDGMLRVSLSEVVAFAGWFERLFATLRDRRGMQDLRLNQLVGEFLVALDRDLHGASSSGLPLPLAKLMQTMRRDLRSDWLGDDIAEAGGLSQSQMRRLFLRHLKATPRQWLLRERLMQAQTLLVSSEMPLAEVADRCGFCDVYHFSREFKRTVGSPPATWRRNERGRSDLHGPPDP